MEHVFAYTDPNVTLMPSFLNVSDAQGQPTLTIRGRQADGQTPHATFQLPPEQLILMACAILERYGHVAHVRV